MRTVAIVGVGLIGASFGLAVRKSGFQGEIVGVSSASAIEAGLRSGAISKAATLAEAAAVSDLIYLAQPVNRILDTLALLGSMTSGDTLITDAGSTKAAIVRQAALNLNNARFVGGHPMAGKETRGAQSADADLFRGRPYVLTSPLDQVPEHLTDLLISMGADLLYMTPEEHDATVALTSHLPQMVSTALASFLAQQPQPRLDRVFGTGLLDMTRLSLSPLDLWQSIIASNRENVGQAIKSYIDALSDLHRAIEADELSVFFSRAVEFSSSLRKLNH